VHSPIPWRLLLLSVLIVSLSTQPVFLLGAGFLQIGEELEFSTTGLGVLTALFFLTASVASPRLGKVVQRIGWRKALRINALLSGSILLLIALIARSTVLLGVMMIAAAAVYGLANPAANLTLAEYVHPRRRALTFALKHAGIPTSTLLAGLAVPLLIVTVGWRWAYVAASLLTLVVIGLIPRAPRPVPDHSEHEDPRRFLEPLSVGLLVGLGAASALATTAAIALSTYLVAAAVDNGFSEPGAGLLLFAGSVSSIAGRIVAGLITDRVGAKGFAGIGVLAGLGAVVFALLPAADGAAFAVLVLAAFATGWAWPGLMTYSVVNANPGTVAASSAIAQSGVFVGAGLSPIVLGLIADANSFDAIWLTVAAALAGAAVSATLVGRSAVAARR
jgi:predicted MFS family arabinose efflux permease